MKLRVTLIDSTGTPRDVSLTVDVTATVGEVARGLVRAGAGDPALLPVAVNRVAPLTLRVRLPSQADLILDAGDPLGHSGVQAGSTVEPVLESNPGVGRRSRMHGAVVTVQSGSQSGVTFLAAHGENTIGRDRTNRIELHDASVSRRHAALRIQATGIVLEDLASANGILVLGRDGSLSEPISQLPITATTEVVLGEVKLQIEVGPAATAKPPFDAVVSLLPSPRVDPVYAPDSYPLPTPPDPPEPGRFPLIAMLAPLVMGTVLYLTTKSVLSLIFIGMSPLIMVGTWLDNRLIRGRAFRAKHQEFVDSLRVAETDLSAAHAGEQLARSRESLSAESLLGLPTHPAGLLWTRRPEHRAFLELRLGSASMLSRTRIELPARGKISADTWQTLTAVRNRFAHVESVPVLERLDRCGSLGVAGPRLWSEAVARSILVQLLALHSPADLVVTAFANERQSRDDWAWMKWLPHVDSAFSPLGVPHLASDVPGSSRLLTDIEGLVATRAMAARRATVRSHLSESAADVNERLLPVDAPSVLPAIIILVLSSDAVVRSRLVGLAEDGADVGVHVIWVADSLHHVPAACRTTVEVSENHWRVHLVRQGETIQLTSLDALDWPRAETFGRALAPCVDVGARILDESDLPASVALSSILPADVIGTSDAVHANWRETDSLTRRWREGAERHPGQLAAAVGQGSGGTVSIDLRAHGPHALVGGTTGSGKSEFLQTWILSLAAQYSPDRLTFLLIDYKGGAAFAECTTLPHTVGLVTDLNTHLVRRALTSLRAELRYREELLAEKGAKDLITLERRSDPQAPPALIIVIDEFAALASEIPDFVDGVIDVAQRGRSLGLHLVMATQRPAGVITDNLRANTNLRIGLRMADPADSSDVLGVADAAAFAPELPGRAAVKVGAGRLTHFQTGYLGGRAEAQHQECVEVRTLGYGEHTPWALQPEARPAALSRSGSLKKKGPRDIEVLTSHIQQAARVARVVPPRKPWVAELPAQITLPGLMAERQCPTGDDDAAGAEAASFHVVLGLRDEPHKQRQTPYRLDLTEVGNLVVYGRAGSGKTMALMTVAVAALRRAPDAHIYGVDAGGGGLSPLKQLPNTGDIIMVDEHDRVVRLLRMLRTEIARRTAEKGAAQGQKDPPTLLLIDGFCAFRDACEHVGRGVDPFSDLIEITRAGRAVGVHVVFTAERAVGLPHSIASSVAERLALPLTAETDYQMFGVPAAILSDAPPGRVVRLGRDEEIQLATPGIGPDPSDTDAVCAELAALASTTLQYRPTPIPEIPWHVSREELQHATQRANGSDPVPAAFAVDTVHLDPVPAPTEGLLLVTGPAGSGRSTAIRTLLETLQEGAARNSLYLDAVLISPQASKLQSLSVWHTVADSRESRRDVIESLTVAIGGHSHLGETPLSERIGGVGPEKPTGARAVQRQFPLRGSQGIVVIEDIGGFDGSGDERALAQLLQALRTSGITVIVEGENATVSAVWELTNRLRGAKWALALQPDANDVPSLFTTPFTHARRADSPPGRGYIVAGGKLTGVQVAVPCGQTRARRRSGTTASQ